MVRSILRTALQEKYASPLGKALGSARPRLALNSGDNANGRAAEVVKVSALSPRESLLDIQRVWRTSLWSNCRMSLYRRFSSLTGVSMKGLVNCLGGLAFILVGDRGNATAPHPCNNNFRRRRRSFVGSLGSSIPVTPSGKRGARCRPWLPHRQAHCRGPQLRFLPRGESTAEAAGLFDLH